MTAMRAVAVSRMGAPFREAEWGGVWHGTARPIHSWRETRHWSGGLGLRTFGVPLTDLSLVTSNQMVRLPPTSCGRRVKVLPLASGINSGAPVSGLLMYQAYAVQPSPVSSSSPLASWNG